MQQPSSSPKRGRSSAGPIYTGAKRGRPRGGRATGKCDSSVIINITRGTFNQGDGRFAEISRGRQCTAIAAVACVGMQIRRLNDWNSADVDAVLTVGDALYRRSLSTGPRRQFDFEHRHYLTVTELCGDIAIFGESVNFTPDETVHYYGHIAENRPPFLDLGGALLKFFFTDRPDGSDRFAVVTGNYKSVAVGKIRAAFFYFDSHGLDSRGRIDAGGLAGIARFGNCAELRDAVVRNLIVAEAENVRPNDVNCNAYTLVPLTIDRRSSTPIAASASAGSAFNVSAAIEDSQRMLTALSVTSPSARTTRGEVPPATTTTTSTTPKRVREKSSNGGRIRKIVRVRSPLFATNGGSGSAASGGNGVEAARSSVERRNGRADLLNNINVINNNNNNNNRRAPGVAPKLLRPPVRHNLGKLGEVACPYCGSLFFVAENVDCCKRGAIDLPPVRYPDLLKKLLTGRHEFSASFRRNVVQYNNMFAFASMGARFYRPPGVGPNMYIVQGLIYHQVRDVYPGAPAKYAQLYYLDPELAREVRSERNPGCPTGLLEEIDLLLRSINPFAMAYKTLREAISEERERLGEGAGVAVDIPSAYVSIESNRLRRYNRPEVDYEFAAVFEAVDDGRPPPIDELRVYHRNEPVRLRTLPVGSPLAEPMCFPFIFPYGESGWSANLPYVANDSRVPPTAGSSAASSTSTSRTSTRRRGNITRREFAVYRLSVRRNGNDDDDDDDDGHDDNGDRFNPILNAGKLTQQYVVDAYIKIETDRLNYLRTHQLRLRAHEYAGLHDYLETVADRENIAVGRIVILPSTFTGSPRSMHEHYQDAMAIVARFGRPDYFVTFTCNPNWPEIAQSKANRDETHNRPDLTCRVFLAKFQSFLLDLTAQRLFGTAVSYVYAIEFQKRGLPHVHVLLNVAEEDKPRHAEQIDAIVSAEIPDAVADAQLHNLVAKHMIHGPCGSGYNEASVCIDEDGKCAKRFPKRFADRTETGGTGYPEYRRRDIGRTVSVSRANRVYDNIDNRFVVPYNKYLLLKYNAHINVEVCHSIRSVKYIYDYVYKGHDCALLRIDVSSTGVYDETTHFVDSRYVGAPEAYWRIRAFTLQGMSHSVVRLKVHLPGQKTVYFVEGKERDALESAAAKSSMFEAWFELNRTNGFARNHFYNEIPYYFLYDEKTRKWKRRQKNVKIVSRVYTVSPRNRELFYLRTLLFHVRGPRSFEELRTVNGTVCETFFDAARALGLTGEDTEWFACLAEAVPVMFPKRLRKLFVTILAFCEVADPLRLWNAYRDEFSLDFVRKGFDAETARERALRSVRILLRYAGVDYATLNLPPLPDDVEADRDVDDVDDDDETRDAESTPDALIADVAENKAKFNGDQRDAYEKFASAVFRDGEQRLFFLDGPGGTGKTFLYNTLLSELKCAGKKYVAVAWTGIAAILLRDGRTVHSRFRLPFDMNAESSSGLALDSDEANEIREADLIVWDEITMTTVHAFDAVDRFLRALMRDGRPFGNKVVVVGGDFRQCLPVVPNGNRTKTVEACVINANSWRGFQRVRLTRNMRADESERRFAAWLLKLGEGALGNAFLTTSLSSSSSLNSNRRYNNNNNNGNNNNNNNSGDDEIVQIPPECVTGNVIEAVYGRNFRDIGKIDFANRVILAPRNDDCEKINAKMLEKISGTGREYASVDKLVTDEPQQIANYPVEILHSLTPPGMPPHVLTLKVGVPVILLRNVSIREGLCNGTRLMVKTLRDNLIEAEITSCGVFKGKTAFLHRMDLTAEKSVLPFPMVRRQFPIRVCFAVTINKAQGQTFEAVGLYLERPVFAHGHLYVAFSRVKSFGTIKVQVFDRPGVQGRLISRD